MHTKAHTEINIGEKRSYANFIDGDRCGMVDLPTNSDFRTYFLSEISRWLYFKLLEISKINSEISKILVLYINSIFLHQVQQFKNSKDRFKIFFYVFFLTRHSLCG